MQKDIGEKPAIMMVEDIGNDDDLQKPQVKKDYSGVAAKTDPAEIALVKKLDRWIMPMLWVRNTPSIPQDSANVILFEEHVLAQLLGSKCHCPGSSQRSRGGSQPDANS